MAYKKIKSYNFSEEELRKMWSDIYCDKPILTFDNIEVYFYSNMFDHCFYESDKGPDFPVQEDPACPQDF